MRLKLSSPNPDGRTAGFVTLSTWGFDITNIPGSSESTPFHTASFKKFQNEKVLVDHNLSFRVKWFFILEYSKQYNVMIV